MVHSCLTHVLCPGCDRLLRQGFTEQEMRLAEFEALIIRRSRRLSQFDREVNENDEELHCDNDYSDTLSKGRLDLSSSSNLSEERSPVKAKITFSRNQNCSLLLASSSVTPLSPPPSLLNRACTMWQSGGSPDQPLRGAPKRSLDESAVEEEVSAALLVDEEQEEEELRLVESSVASEAGLGTDHAVFSATERLPRRSSISSDHYSSTTSFDRMVSSLPPMQPLVIPARTA